jgi:decaprenylphospho-beta-D-erythro-pentofuranosid-2-ulose 2-reductase
MQDAFGNPQSVVVLGGTSEIARDIVDLLAAQRCRTVVLAGRDTRALEQRAAELSRTVTKVATVSFGATATDEVE